jgi:hypothetical protein
MASQVLTGIAKRQGSAGFATGTEIEAVLLDYLDSGKTSLLNRRGDLYLYGRKSEISIGQRCDISALLLQVYASPSSRSP